MTGELDDGKNLAVTQSLAEVRRLLRSLGHGRGRAASSGARRRKPGAAGDHRRPSIKAPEQRTLALVCFGQHDLRPDLAPRPPQPKAAGMAARLRRQ